MDLRKNDILSIIRIFSTAFELDVNIANFVYYGKTSLVVCVVILTRKIQID